MSLDDYLDMALQFLLDHHLRTGIGRTGTTVGTPSGWREAAERLLGKLESGFDDAVEEIGEALLKALVAAWRRFGEDQTQHEDLLALIKHYLEWLAHALEGAGSLDDSPRRNGIMLELGTVAVAGMLEDGVLTDPEGLDAIDPCDFRAWPRRHGASEQAGMGDTIFGPVYPVLRERGVRFRFFHQVESLGLNAACDAIDRIDVGVQATLNSGEAGHDPLVNVRHLPCWPARPLYGQLVQGDELKEKDVKLGSFYAGWENPGHVTLECGRDFDQVVLGISIAGFPWLCRELMDADPAFRTMVEQVGTVRTQAAQFWLDRDLGGLGWEKQSPVMDAYVEPLNTRADMSQLVDRESWPDGAVGNIAYFCGPIEGGLEPPETRDAPLIARTRARETALGFAQASTEFLWPGAVAKDNPFGLDFDRLVADPAPDSGLAHFDAQFFRANIDPSERYVPSLKGTTTARLPAGGTRFANLTLAGDWTRNGFNAGCIEATTMSGMQASNAISGFPAIGDISGLDAIHAKKLVDMAE